MQKQPPEVSCNFIKKETLAQVFFSEFSEISKNTFFTEHLQVTTSLNGLFMKDGYSQRPKIILNVCVHFVLIPSQHLPAQS